MDSSSIDYLFSSEINFIKAYEWYELIPFDKEIFRQLVAGRGYKSKRRIVMMGGKCNYCPRRCDYIFHGKHRRKFETELFLLSSDLVELTVDHIFPISKGGDDVAKNRQVLCLPCNAEKADKLGPPIRARQVLIGK